MSEAFDPLVQLPGEYEVGKIVRGAVDYDPDKGRMYLLCSVGELAQRIAAAAPINLEDNEALREAVLHLAGALDRLTGALDWCNAQAWGGRDIDGGDYQAKMLYLGLLVEVPADEAFQREFESETMLVPPWQLTREQLGQFIPELAEDEDDSGH